MSPNHSQFADLRYDDFRKLARDPSLSRNERIGFPDSFREGYADVIFADIGAKLPGLAEQGKRVLDIGPGCGELAFKLIDLCRRQGHQLFLADCEEMLEQLPDEPFIKKIPGFYPETADTVAQAAHGVDVAVCYSVLHYIYVDANLNEFLDKSLELLAPGGSILIGDIPNASKHNRFFESEAGKAFHKETMGYREGPVLKNPDGQINDSVLLDLISQGRSAGADVYIMPQPWNLPMANRREDILIRKP